MKACAYLRKSREDEERERLGKFETLARHKRQLEALAAERGDTVERWHRETISGETIAARPEMTALLQSVARGEWQAVYCMEAARLGRGGGSDQERILNAFRYTGTLLVTPDKVYFPDSPGDMRLLKKELQSSEDELETITARLNRGKRQAAREGIWQATGRTPYGWRAVRVGLDWTLEPDGNHHHMLRIYDLLEEGKGWATIAAIYNAEGIPRPRGGKKWTPSAVQAIARNPANCGMVTYAKTLTVREFDPETFAVVKRKVKNPEPIVARGLHYGKGGITPERFQALVGDVRMAKSHADRPLRNPIATLLVCGECGYSMVMKLGGSTVKRRYYVHQIPKRMNRPCRGCKPARADAVLDALLDTLEKTYGSLTADVDGGPVVDARAALVDELERCQRARERILSAYEAGVYGLTDMSARKADIDLRMAHIERRVAELDSRPEPEEVRVSIGECIEALRHEEDAAVVNAALKSVIGRIEYRNDGEPRLDVYMR
jgi:DNA invertase Pin-like site-specific DNA recombinase